MPTRTHERIDALLALARNHIETLHEQHDKVVPLVGFVRGGALVRLFAVPSCNDDDLAFACAVGSAGYRTDGVFLVNEGMAAVTPTNPLTGAHWKDDEIAQVLHLDGGLGVVERDISLAYLEKGRPLEMLTQAFAYTGDRFTWKDTFSHVESDELPMHDDVPRLLRAAVRRPERVTGASRSLEQIALDELFHSLHAGGAKQRDRATTQALRLRGLVSITSDAAPPLALPGDEPSAPD